MLAVLFSKPSCACGGREICFQVFSCSDPDIPSPHHQRGPRTQHGLVCPASTSDDTDHATGAAPDDLLGTGRKLDAGLALIGVVSDNSDVVSGGSAQSATVASLLLDVGDDGTLRHGAQRQDVSDGQGSVLAGVDELTGVHALVCDESLGVELKFVGIAENDLGERCATTGVVDNLLHNTTDVSISLGVVEGSELGGGLIQPSDGLEYGGRTLSLIANDA